MAKPQQREDHVFLVLALVIGALTGLAVEAFILLTQREGIRLYPAGSDRWRRGLFPVVGSLGISNPAVSGTFPTLDAAECRRPRLRCSLAKAISRCVTCWARRAFRSSWRCYYFRARPPPGIEVKALLPVGAAAIAAAFNTPLAAVLFALRGDCWRSAMTIVSSGLPSLPLLDRKAVMIPEHQLRSLLIHEVEFVLH